MKTTYTGTLFHPTNLQEADVKLYIHKYNKYEGGADPEPERVTCTGLISWTVVEGGEEADTIRELTGLYDENNEYLILKFENGKVEIHRNSHVTMFII